MIKRFNESNSISEENINILQEIIEDIWSLYPNKRDFIPDIKHGNILLRSHVTLKPGNMLSISDTMSSFIGQNSDIFGFAIRTTYIDRLPRAIELFKRRTGIQLSYHANDERMVILADPKVIDFANGILEFENGLEEIPYILPPKYMSSVDISVEPNELEIQIDFVAFNRKSRVKGCYLDIKLSRGIMIGDDIPMGNVVKYEVKVGSLWNFQEGRDDPEVWQFARVHKGDTFQIEVDLNSIDESIEELSNMIEKNILSEIGLPDVKFKSKIEEQLNNLEKYNIYPYFEYSNSDLINVEFEWRGDHYQFYLSIDGGNIFINQDEKVIDVVSVEDISESIYLNLMDNKFKISK